MFGWLFNKEKTIQTNGPELTPLVKKLHDWVMSITKSNMITQGDSGDGYDIYNSEWKEDGYLKSAYTLWEKKDDKTGKAIDIIRVENTGVTMSDYMCTYLIREVCNGDDKLDATALKRDNLKPCNGEAIEDMYWHIKTLHRYSKEQYYADKAKKEIIEKYNNFVENF